MQTELQKLYDQLLAICRAEGSLLVAYSGGVDSTLCAYAAHQALGGRAQAAFFRTPLITDAEEASARRLAEAHGLPLHVLHLDPLAVPEVRQNRRERCYYCKRALYGELRKLADQLGLARMADGNNADDLAAGNRPGGRAATELDVFQPLARLALTKAQVRALARELGLANHALPSRPCLATRFPYDTELTAEALARAAAGEQLLHQAGLTQFRLRVHGQLARIEVAPAEQERLLSQAPRLEPCLRALGYEYVTLDLAGLQSGRYDQPAR